MNIPNVIIINLYYTYNLIECLGIPFPPVIAQVIGSLRVSIRARRPGADDCGIREVEASLAQARALLREERGE
jgi:hypothetical protein